jgi:hypothetical protein
VGHSDTHEQRRHEHKSGVSKRKCARASERAIVKGELEFRIAESSCDDHRGYALVNVQSKNDDDDSEAQRNVGWGKITTQSPWARTPRILLFCRISPSASTYAFRRDQPTCGRAKKDTTQPPVKSRVVVARVDSQARFRRPPFPVHPPPFSLNQSRGS